MGIIGALAAHLLLFVLIFASMRGAIVTGGAGTGETVTPIMLVSLAGLQGAPHQATPEAALDTMFHRLRAAEAPSALDAQTTPTKPASKTSLEKLMDEVDRDANPDEKTGTNGHSTEDKGGSGASDQTNAKTRSDKPEKPSPGRAGAGDNGPSAGGLWGQIEPCWRKLPGRSTVPVSLEIVLNEQGVIAIPPKIIRPAAAALSEGRLTAEARALAAITACVPYRGPSPFAGRQMFKVDFQASR